MKVAISLTKANQLFWLGRYVERVYISLHIYRMCFDRMIDNLSDENEYYRILSANSSYPDPESFCQGYMFDRQNLTSLISSIEMANDNAILLREEITSETLSYVQLSLVLIKQKASEEKPQNITDLQSITDYMLAFWGSVDERVKNNDARNLMFFGRLIENMDMHVRFNYPFHRVREVFDRLLALVPSEEKLFNEDALKQLDDLLTPERYLITEDTYKGLILNCINQLVLV